MQILKYLFFIGLIAASCMLHAQTYFGKVKCDSFLVMQDTSRALIHQKNKTGVFDKEAHKYLVKPAKSTLLYLPYPDLLIQISKKSIAYVYLNEQGELAKIESENSLFSRAYFSQRNLTVHDSLMRLGAFIWNYKTGERVIEKSDDFLKYYKNSFMLKRVSDDLLEVNYRIAPDAFYAPDVEKLSLENTGTATSGVYNIRLRKWVVPPIYEYVDMESGNVICLKRNTFTPILDSNYEAAVEISHLYDFYAPNHDGFDLIQENISNNNTFDLARFIGVDSVENRAHEMGVLSHEYITYKDGKQGLVEFQLYAEQDFGVLGPSDFVYNELLPLKYDFILNDLKGGKVITYDSNSQEPFSLYSWVENKDCIELPVKEFEVCEEIIREWQLDLIITAKTGLIYGESVNGQAQVLVDDVSYTMGEILEQNKEGMHAIRKPKKTIQNSGFPASQSKSCGLKLWNDSLLSVINFENDGEASTYGHPLQSILYPDEDSIIFTDDGDAFVIYPSPQSGYEKSGVFNLNSNRYLFEDNYKMIHKQENGFLLHGVQRTEDDYWDYDEFSLMQLDGSYTFQNLSSESPDKYLDEQFTSLFGVNNLVTSYNYPEKSGYREDGGYEQGAWRYNGDYYAVVLESGEWQVQQPVQMNKQFNPIPITKPAEFVHYNPSNDYYFWMDQDSIYLEIDDDIFATSRENGKFTLESYRNECESESFDAQRIHLVSGVDTVSHAGFTLSEGIPNLISASFYVQGDLLFINEQQKHDNITPNMYELDAGFEDDLTEFVSFKKMDTETSYICKLVDGVWNKVTPYYANIEGLPFGYLATLGAEEVLIDQYDWVMEKKERAYIVIDSNFKAISYLDFYDFSDAIIHPFGIQLRMGEHYFLLDNNGKMITSADWDEFIIENDQLKAIRYHPMTPDLNFDLAPGEEIDEIKFYSLPKY